MTSWMEKGFAGQAITLVAFGYHDITADMVRECHEAWLKGETAHGVIGMFCEEAFRLHPEIFGTRKDEE